MATKKNGLIVLPDDGSHGMRDDPNYNAEIQLLANRGYCALMSAVI